MKKTLLLILGMVLCIVTMQGQAETYPDPVLKFDDNDTMPNDSVIISEVLLPDWWNWGYVELTNMSHEPVHLANFFMLGRYPGRNWEGFAGNDNKVNLKGTLLPGESYIIAYAKYSPDILNEEGELLFKEGIEINEVIWEMADTLFTYGSQRGGSQFALFSRYQALDSVGNVVSIDSAATDVFNCTFQDNNKSDAAIAGLGPGSPVYTLWHRKYDVGKGNIDWNVSRGDDLISSEWIYTTNKIREDFNKLPFTTIGVHEDNKTFDITSKGNISIDLENRKMTIPYGIPRDSVFRREFNLTNNYAWELKVGLDTAEYFVQNRDTIIFYNPGSLATLFAFDVEVLPIPNSFNLIRPKITKTPAGIFAYNYTYSFGNEPIDTIGSIPYDLRIDTFLNNIVLDEGITYEILPANGSANPDIKYGDTLKIIAKNGSVKKYKLCVKDYIEDFTARIETIILPGLQIWENPKTFFFTDTFLGFSSLSYTYNISLPEGTETSPAILAIPHDPNSKVEIMRAKNLNGSEMDRTATVIVYSEDRMDTAQYTFTFKVDKPTPELDYSPFFSDFGDHWGIANSAAMQIYNPHDELLDMSDYMVVKNQNGWDVSTTMQKMYDDTNKWNFRPGYMVVRKDGGAFFEPDFNQKNQYVEAKSVFSLINARSYPFEGVNSSVQEAQKVDYRVFREAVQLPREDNHGYWPDYYGNGRSLFYGMDKGGPVSWMHNGGSTYLLKITNDSVKDGTKAMNADFINDYEIVDIFNGWNNRTRVKIYDIVDGKDTTYSTGNWWGLNMYRKPNVYKGNPVELGSFGIGNDSVVIKPGEWTIYSSNYTNGQTDDPVKIEISRKRFENHVMDYREHIASVSSVKYNVTDGIVGVQDIYGIATGTTVQNFINNLILAHSNASVKVMNNGVEKTASETLAASDQLYSYSVRGTDSVIYNLNFGVLDNDVALTSTEYTITIAADKKTGTITGIPYGATINEALGKITKPELAKLAVTNGAETIIPTERYNNDTIKVQNEQYTEVIIGDYVYFEVTAQNGDVCLYDLVWETAEDPFVLSNVYVVDQESKEINFVSEVSLVTFMNNLIPGPGCTIKVQNKAFIDRKKGDLKWDDRLVVSNGAKSVTYFIKFSEGESYVAIDNVKTDALVNAYPNPSTGLFYLGNTDGTKQLKVYNITGKLIKTVNVASNSATLDLTKENNGLYIVKFSGKKNHVVKVIKE